MESCYPTRFDHAMAFLFSGRDHSIGEDLVQLYCLNGLLTDTDGVLQVTDRGRAELRKSRHVEVAVSRS